MILKLAYWPVQIAIANQKSYKAIVPTQAYTTRSITMQFTSTAQFSYTFSTLLLHCIKSPSCVPVNGVKLLQPQLHSQLLSNKL